MTEKGHATKRPTWAARSVVLTVGISLGSAIAAEPPASCELHTVLLEDFNELSVSATRLGASRWTAHTPWSGDFGDAAFTNPGPRGPFKVEDGVLTITASKDRNGKWTSGLLAAADSSGAGTGTRYGYFEARMKMPPGPGTWPAFWLAALKPATMTEGNVELDVIEYYGQFTSAYQAATHIWYKQPHKTRGEAQKITVPNDALVQDFHTFGVDISPQAVVFFFDRTPVWSQPTPPELDGPLYPLVNLALGGGWPIDQTPSPSTLLIDYVHVYGRGPGPAEGCPPAPEVLPR